MAEIAMLVVLSVIGIVGLVIIATLLRGWVLSILWGWFAVPIFGLLPLGLAPAIAVAFMVAFLTHQYVPSKENDKWQPWISILIGPFIALGFGWVIKQYL